MTDHWAEDLPEPLVQSIARLNGRLREYGFEYSVKPISGSDDCSRSRIISDWTTDE